MNARKLLPFCFVVIFSYAACAQNEIPSRITDQNRFGDLPFSTSVGTDIEHVDMATGALTIMIPFFKIPGRGMDSALALRWNSNYFLLAPRVDGLGRPYFQWTIQANSGWQTNAPVSTFASVKNVKCTLNGGYLFYDSNYIYIDESGSAHPLAMEAETGGACAPPGAGTATGPDMTAAGMSGQATNNSIGSLKRADGTTESGGIWTIVDSNGNKRTQTIDTLGQTYYTVTTSTSVPGCVSQDTYTYTDSSGTSQTYKVCWQAILVTTNFPAGSGPYGASYQITNSSWNVIKSITLPNNQQYVFKYTDPYGGITEIDLPTGGVITYTYSNLTDKLKTRRFVSSRTETVNGTVSTWNFGVTVPSPTNYDNSTYVTTVTFPAVGNPPVQNQSVFTSYGSSVTDAKLYAGSAQGTPLREYKIDYSIDADPTTDDICYNPGGLAPPLIPQMVGVRPIRITTILEDGQTQSKKELDYETFTYTYRPNHCDDLADNQVLNTYTTSRGNVTEIREFDWGVGSQPLVRRTDKTYLHNSNGTYLTYNIVNKVLQSTVYDGSSNQKAQTQYEYDNYVVGQNPLVSTSSTPAPQHDYTNFSSTFTYRGNATRVKRWRNTDSALLTMMYQYDDLGNIRAITDPLGIPVGTYSYLDSWSGSSCLPSANAQAYVTQFTDAMGYRVQRTYYPCTGLLQARKDENDIRASRAGTTYQYDLLGRTTQKILPDSGQVSTGYVDTPPMSVTTTTKVTGSLNLVSTAVEDGLGRVKQTQLTSDPDGTDYVDTTYDALGRTSTVSNPYRSTSDTSYGVSTTVYDALNRVKQLIPPDGTSSANNVSTGYSLTCSTVTDQAGKSRKSCSDGLGRLTAVWEDPAGLNYETDYQYDALDNLIRVDQKGGSSDSGQWRSRTFTYNSLSLLLCSANPEIGIATCPNPDNGNYTAGTVRYNYDNDNRLISKIAPKPNQLSPSTTVTATYGYDNDYRLKSKTYDDGTAAVSFGFDGNAPSGCTPPSLTMTNPIYRRTGMCDASGSTAWNYDAMGRVLTELRQITGVASPKTIANTYNLDGSLATLTYPSSRVVTYTPNSSGTNTAARTFSATDSGNTYVTNAHYDANANLTDGTFGYVSGSFNGIIGKFSFNNRLQPIQWIYTTGSLPTQQQLGQITCPPNIGTLMHRAYNFANGTADNGNVSSFLNCRDSNRGENFGYDSLNRITQGYTTGTNWGETFAVDAWGNLTNKAQYPGKTMYESLNAAPASSQNHLNGFGYDAAGNMTSNGPATYSYDAEGRITTTAGVTYTYDGDGKRVKKSSGKLYWTGTGSDPLAESDLSGNFTEEYVFFSAKRLARRDFSSGLVHYYVSDHLGTSSVISSNLGVSQEESDYYPYGGEIPISGSDPNTYKFTGKERDTESGLDNFGARYDASSLGRFMTPDPIHIMKQKLLDPQQWNMYAYVRNNPLRFVDPTGKYLVNCGNGDKKCNKAADKFEKQREKDLKSKDLKVQDAAKAWGSRGEDNHVNVTFKPQSQVDADAHTAPGYTTQAFVRPGAGADHQPNIQAEFSESLGGSSLGQVIAHEGSHIEDDMSFLNSYNGATGKYNPGLNFTHFDTEFQAFEAGSGVKSYSEFQRGPKGYQQLEGYIYRAYPNADDLVFPPAVFPQ